MQADEAVEKFKLRLLTGVPAPGAFVTLREIAGLLDVPLAKARETAQRLELEGFVRIHAQRGVQVRDITLKSIRAAFGFRAILEEAALRSYVGAHVPDERREVEAATRALAEAAPSLERAELARRVVEVDWRMHFAFVASLGNPFLSQAYEVNAAHIRWIRASSAIPAPRLEAVLREHLAILAACERRDEEAALGLLREHLDNSLAQALAG